MNHLYNHRIYFYFSSNLLKASIIALTGHDSTLRQTTSIIHMNCVLSWFAESDLSATHQVKLITPKDINRLKLDYQNDLFLGDGTQLCVLIVWRFLWLQCASVYLGVHEQRIFTTCWSTAVNHNIVEVRATTWWLKQRTVFFLNHCQTEVRR